MKIIPIIHSFNERFVIPAAVSFLSMLRTIKPQPDTKYILYVIHTDITEKSQNKLNEIVSKFKFAELKFLNLKDQQVVIDSFNRFKSKQSNHYTIEVLFKMSIAKIFSQYDSAIMTDVDVLWKNDITEHFDEFIKNDQDYIAGIHYETKVPEICEWADKAYSKFSAEERDVILNKSIGGGYLFSNLKKIREDHMEDRLLDYFEKNAEKLIQLEQDVINVVYYPHVYHLPVKAMVCTYLYEQFKGEIPEEYATAMKDPTQIHYAGRRKPWNDLSVPFTSDWFKVLADTPFWDDYFVEYKRSYIHDSPNQYEMDGVRNYLKQVDKKRHKYKRFFNYSMMLNCLLALSIALILVR